MCDTRSVSNKCASPPHRIRTVVFESGERMPMLVRTDTGMPEFDACVYAMTEVRPRSGSASTIEQALRGIQFLLAFTEPRSIDLHERFADGRFLDLHELDELVAFSRMPFRREAAESTGQGRRRQGTSPRRTARNTVSASTASIRLHYAKAHLAWLGHVTAARVCSTLEQRGRYMDLLQDFLGRASARMPPSRTLSARLSLDKDTRAELLRVIDPLSIDNPWSSEFHRDRNRLLILWGIGTGLRRGELLGLRIKALNFRRNMADIVRRQDDADDPRVYQPNTKTRERSIGISEELAYVTHEHIVRYRSKLRAARKHDFLFVADSGTPLSLSSVTKIFRSLRQRHPQLGQDLSCHVLRHSWNDDFSDIADRAKLSPDDERRARNHAMGWSEVSRSADAYLTRRTRRLAAKASRQIQKHAINDGETI